MCDITQIVVHGEQGLYLSSIRGITQLTVSGLNAMSASTVISQVENGNTFTAYINGTNDNFYDIYCNSTDICRIACESSSACSTLRLYCFGSCFVSCNQDNGIDCPYSGVYSQWITSSPTSIPSIQPSVITTDNSSTAPVAISTTHPSHMTSADSIQSSASPNEPSSYPSTRHSTAVDITGGGTTTSTINNDENETESLLNQTMIVVVICIIVFIVCAGVLCCGVILVMHQRSNESKERLKIREKEIEIKKLQTLAANPNLVTSLSALTSLGVNMQLPKYPNLQAKMNPTPLRPIPPSSTNHVHNAAALGRLNQVKSVSLERRKNSNESLYEQFRVECTTNVNKNVNANQVATVGEAYRGDRVVIVGEGGDGDLLSSDEDGIDVVYDANAAKESEGVGDGDVVTGAGGKKFDISQANAAVGIPNTASTSGVGGGDGLVGSRIVIDETKYVDWTQKQVILWMKTNLDYNGIDPRVTRTFLGEFYQKQINGAMLKQLQQNPESIEQLKREFLPKNQVLDLWLVAQFSILSLGDQDEDFND